MYVSVKSSYDLSLKVASSRFSLIIAFSINSRKEIRIPINMAFSN